VTLIVLFVPHKNNTVVRFSFRGTIVSNKGAPKESK